MRHIKNGVFYFTIDGRIFLDDQALLQSLTPLKRSDPAQRLGRVASDQRFFTSDRNDSGASDLVRSGVWRLAGDGGILGL